MSNRSRTLDVVQSLAANLAIEPPYIVVIAAQIEALKVDKMPNEVLDMSWEDYRVLVSKIRRGSVELTTFFTDTWTKKAL